MVCEIENYYKKKKTRNIWKYWMITECQNEDCSKKL